MVFIFVDDDSCYSSSEAGKERSDELPHFYWVYDKIFCNKMQQKFRFVLHWYLLTTTAVTVLLKPARRDQLSAVSQFTNTTQTSVSHWEQTKTLQTQPRPSLSLRAKFTNRSNTVSQWDKVYQQKQRCSATKEYSERVIYLTSEKTMMIFENCVLVGIFGKINNSRGVTSFLEIYFKRTQFSRSHFKFQFQQIFIK